MQAPVATTVLSAIRAVDADAVVPRLRNTSWKDKQKKCQILGSWAKKVAAPNFQKTSWYAPNAIWWDWCLAWIAHTDPRRLKAQLGSKSVDAGMCSGLITKNACIANFMRQTVFFNSPDFIRSKVHANLFIARTDVAYSNAVYSSEITKPFSIK